MTLTICACCSQVIKSARVMKKAVGHLIPFMEKEREAEEARMRELGLEITEEVSLMINPLGPIADIPAIISTICFRRHNLCKKCQNLTTFSHIEEYKKPLKKQ